MERFFGLEDHRRPERAAGYSDPKEMLFEATP